MATAISIMITRVVTNAGSRPEVPEALPRDVLDEELTDDPSPEAAPVKMLYTSVTANAIQ